MNNSDRVSAAVKGVRDSLTQDLMVIYQENHRLPWSPDIKELCARISAVSAGVASSDPAAITAVKEWRTCLMRDRFNSTACRGLVRDWFRLKPLCDGQCSLWGVSPALVSAFNCALMLFWKLRKDGVTKVDTSEYRNRLSRSGSPSLTDDEASRIRDAMRLGECPPLTSLRGKNGPGAVAEGIKGAQKWVFKRRPTAVPLSFYTCCDEHEAEMTPLCAPYKYGIARSLQVPKDVRGPRFIACEPLGSQHAQFAYEGLLKAHLSVAFRKHVFLASQRDHNRMLWQSSATIDLSDASDYISRRLIWRVLPYDWARALFAVRSSFVDVDGQIVPLRAFAPMGSALCFPVMTLVIASALRASGLRHFHVYGDDVIVRLQDYSQAISWLEKLGVRINHAKSCSHGLFKESCGVELFDATDVTPVYIRRLVSNDHRVETLHLYHSAVRLGGLGFTCMATFLLQQVHGTMEFARASLIDPTCFGRRWNPDYQRLEVRWPVETARTQEDLIDGYPGVLRWLCTGSAPKVGAPYTTGVDLRPRQTRVKWVWLAKDMLFSELARCRLGAWFMESLA